VPTRDGSSILVNVYRPDGHVPVPVIASMSPYGKDVHWPERYPLYDLVPNNDHMVWETPDPEWWTTHGYALLRADTLWLLGHCVEDEDGETLVTYSMSPDPDSN